MSKKTMDIYPPDLAPKNGDVILGFFSIHLGKEWAAAFWSKHHEKWIMARKQKFDHDGNQLPDYQWMDVWAFDDHLIEWMDFPAL